MKLAANETVQEAGKAENLQPGPTDLPPTSKTQSQF